MNIAVVGSGTMGSGIAQTCAQYGHDVVLLDINGEALTRAENSILKSLKKLEEKGRLPEGEDAQSCSSRLRYSSSYSDLSDRSLVIEAVFERLDVKASVIQEIDKHVSPDTIIGSNTSSISITELANYCSHPSRFLGVHFMNPVPLMKLVELIKGNNTNPKVTEQVIELCQGLSKVPVTVEDYPGFVSNRILMPMINEAVQCLMEGVADAEAIDTVMKLGMAHPMGPLTLADLIGLDICLDIMEVLHEGLGDKYRPCPLLRRKVMAGELGRKSGQGFYSYE